jgi:hypothetical protein
MISGGRPVRLSVLLSAGYGFGVLRACSRRKAGDVRAEHLNALAAWTRDVLLKGPTQDGQLTSERRV